MEGPSWPAGVQVERGFAFAFDNVPRSPDFVLSMSGAKSNERRSTFALTEIEGAESVHLFNFVY